jgi:hypothetical protein
MTRPRRRSRRTGAGSAAAAAPRHKVRGERRGRRGASPPHRREGVRRR